MRHALRSVLDDLRNSLRVAKAPPEEAAEAAPAEAAPAEAHPTESDSATLAADRDEAMAGAAEASAAEPASAPKRRLGWPAWTGAAAFIVLSLALLRWAPWQAREPADPEVVATFQGGTVTRAQLVQQWQAIPPMERRLYLSATGLKSLIGHIAVDEVTRRWAEERQVDGQETFKEAMKHATEAIQMSDLAEQFHQGRIPVGEAEIQAYYDQNRQRFGERPLVEVREQIRQAVVEQKERVFVDDYLKQLRERASLQVDVSLLDVPEPTEAEIAAYYQANRARFHTPEQATVAQLQVSVSLAGGDAQARAKAEAARARAAAVQRHCKVLADGA